MNHTKEPDYTREPNYAELIELGVRQGKGEFPMRSETCKALAVEVERLRALLSCRAGKLLAKGKPFVVVANDEVYFTAVYSVIREAEQAEGTWTKQCEEQFQELTHYDNSSYFPVPCPELESLARQQLERRRLRDAAATVLDEWEDKGNLEREVSKEAIDALRIAAKCTSGQ